MTTPPIKTHTENRVNGDIPGLAETRLGSWDHRSGDPVALGCLDLHTKKDSRLLEVNQPSEYAKLPEDEKAALQAWIREKLVPASSPGRYSSYGLKHTFQDSDGGSYVTNGQFKGAMLVAGFGPLDKYDLNWIRGPRSSSASGPETSPTTVGTTAAPTSRSSTCSPTTPKTPCNSTASSAAPG